MSVTRQVSVRLTSTGGDDVRAQLQGVSEAADRLGTKTATISVDANKEGWEEEYERVLQEAVRLGATRARITVNANTEDWEEKAAAVQAMADRLGLERVNIKVNADTSEAMARLAALRAAAGEAGAGGAGGGGEGESSLMSNPYLLGGAAVLGASVLPSLVGTGIGLGAGALGAYGAYKMGSGAATQIATLQAQAQSDAQAIAKLEADKKLTTSQKATLSSDESDEQSTNAQIAKIKSANQGVLGVYNSIQGILSDAKSTFASALTGGGADSFAAQLSKALSSIGPFIKSEGPELQKMFQGSTPFVKAFVSILETAAKNILPAMVSAMNQMKPYLPEIEHGFADLTVGIGKFIQELGPAMGPSANIFMRLLEGMGGVMTAFGYVVQWTAKIVDGAFVGIGDAIAWLSANVPKYIHDIVNWFDDFRTDVVNVFNTVRSDIRNWFSALVNDFTSFFGGLNRDMNSWGSNIIWGLINGIESAANSLYSYVRRIANDISSAFKSVLGIFSPSRVFQQHGQDIVRGLALGITNNQHLATTAVQGLGRATSNGYASSVGRAGSGAALQIEWVGGQSDGQFMTWLKNNIRVRGGNPAVIGR